MTQADEGKVLFITGASTGIGAAVARHAVREGWRGALCARSEDRLRVTDIEPGLVETPFWQGGRKPEGADFLKDDDEAGAVMYALDQPPHMAVSELLIRPTTQDV